MKLEQRAVSGVWIGREDGVRQVGTQQVGVSNRNHLVIDSIDYECGMTDPLQVCEALTDNMLPLSKCRRLTPRALSVSYAARGPTSGPAVLLLHPRKDVARPPKRGQFSISCLGIAAPYGTLRGLVGDYRFSRSRVAIKRPDAAGATHRPIFNNCRSNRAAPGRAETFVVHLIPRHWRARLPCA
jgi:hypothetical protein